MVSEIHKKQIRRFCMFENFYYPLKSAKKGKQKKKQEKHLMNIALHVHLNMQSSSKEI